MQREIINPWQWQEALGFVHANKVTGATNVMFLAGQTASDENGHCLFAGDMAKQITQVLDNIQVILERGGMRFADVVRLNVYTIDMAAMMAAHDHMVKELSARGCRHAGTLLGVSGLASPGAMIEIEVTAAN